MGLPGRRGRALRGASGGNAAGRKRGREGAETFGCRTPPRAERPRLGDAAAVNDPGRGHRTSLPVAG